MSKVSYTDKTPAASQAPIIGSYNSHGTKTVPPSASQFNKGATNLAEIKNATEQRRAHSAALSDPGRKGWPKHSPLS
jgi:hypothetical protein